MIQGFAEWRRTEEVDFVATEWVFPERMLCKQLYPHAPHKTDKIGRPVQIERPGPADLERCFSEIGDPNLIRNCIWQCEWYKYTAFPACTIYSGQKVENLTQIFDLTGGTMSKLASRKGMALLKVGAKICQDYYPETMGQAFVVNSPALFTALYAVIKGFLDERTRSKVRVMGSNYQSVLLEHIDAENLPTFLGGTCTCSHVEGGCMFSQAGPWEDYVCINKRIYHKSEIEKGKGHGDDEEIKREEYKDARKGFESQQIDYQSAQAATTAMTTFNIIGLANREREALDSPTQYNLMTLDSLGSMTDRS